MTPTTPPAHVARWSRPAPVVFLLASLLVLLPGLDRGQGKSADDRVRNKTAQKVGPPVDAEVRFTDDSVLKLTLRDKVILLNTTYGQLRIPVSNLRYIDFATRIPDTVTRQVDAAVANLGSSQFKVREAAGAELLDLRELSYPALLRAARHKDLEVVRRAEALLKQLREAVPREQLEFRKDDVVYTADSRITGRLEEEPLKAVTFQFGNVQLRLGQLRSLQFAGVAPDPGNLHQLRGLIGKTFRFKVTGSVDGPVYGWGVYTSESILAAAAVHIGALKAGQTGVVRVTIVPPPGGFAASAQNGVTSIGYGPFGGAYQVSRELLPPLRYRPAVAGISSPNAAADPAPIRSSRD
jgi:hypothetical protein